MTYNPSPIDTSEVQLNPSLQELTELLAKNTHDLWAKERLSDGWKYGPIRDDEKRLHPDLVPYENLPEKEKKYDRLIAEEGLKAIIKLGFQIQDPK